jgi:hypothetical protein
VDYTGFQTGFQNKLGLGLTSNHEDHVIDARDCKVASGTRHLSHDFPFIWILGIVALNAAEASEPIETWKSDQMSLETLKCQLKSYL